MRRLALAAAAAALSVTLVASASASTTFSDPAGDAGTAADVTNVVVSSDTTGLITFEVDIANQFAPTDTVDIYVDSDHSASTGDTSVGGAEYDLHFDFADHTWDDRAWNGSGWSESPSHATVQTSYTAAQLTFSINRIELSNTSGFGFWVDSCDGGCDVGREDRAPASGTWFYQAAATVQSISVLASAAPKTVKAGNYYTAVLLLEPSDPSVSLADGGEVECKASVGSSALRTISDLITETSQGQKFSAAACGARVPKTARGKTVRETITVTYQGVTVSRSFSARVTK